MVYIPYKKVNYKNYSQTHNTALKGYDQTRNPELFNQIEKTSAELARTYGSELEISENSIRDSTEIEAAKYPKSKMSSKRIVDRATFIDTLHKQARREGIEDYLPSTHVMDFGMGYVEIPNLGRMDKAAFTRIINYARRKGARVDKRKRGGLENLTTNPVFPIITIAGIVSGLFFLSFNLTGTGNVIGGGIGSVSGTTLLGTGLLAIGLVGSLLWINKH